MALKKYKLGDLIEQTRDVNEKLMFGKKDVKGMTITKEIIDTKANVADADLSKYLVVKPNEFIYNPRTHGKKIGLGFNNTNETFIISWNNIAFKVKDNKKEVISPTYLFMHFNRSEWDREACVNSWGSSTEVFSWETLSSMEIYLPDLSTQEKYVKIYLNLLANQKAYEKGLDDLKHICDFYIEKLRKQKKVNLKGLLIESDERNDKKIAIKEKGVSIQKTFIDTKAQSSDITKQKVVRHNFFAFNSNTSRNSESISIALNKDDFYAVSNTYVVFCTDEKVLLPEYLFLWFKRKEFDRFARYNSWGSARETISIADIEEYEIAIPDIYIQRNIVNILNIYNKRIELSNQIKEQIKNICPILIKGAIEEAKEA